MPEQRLDPLTGRAVILAPERARRGAPDVAPDVADPEPCQFCEGQEGQTPPETFAIRTHGTAPDEPGWRVRVVPNLYPATAAHEVVVHTPDHRLRIEDLDHGRRRAVVLTWRERLAALAVEHAVVVVNRGRAAGASRSHDHSQIFGLTEAAPTVAREAAALGSADCTLCVLALDPELLIAETDGGVVLAHPVPLVAHELLIVPAHEASLRTTATARLGAIGELFVEAIRAIGRLVGSPVPFNIALHCAPRSIERFHWHAHLYPRLAVWGGLELGAELPIVAADPQDTARRLRPA